MDQNKISVLLADDHAVVRDGVRYILESSGEIIVVGQADDGLEAVQLAAELRPDVVVIDISMSGMNGLDATQRIRHVSPETKVVILSMHGTKEHICRALHAGARGYVLKECAGREVIEAVTTVMSGRRYLSDKIADSAIQDYAERFESDVPESPLSTLTPREREVLLYVVEGRTSEEIAQIVSLSRKTVETYRSRSMRKLGMKNLAELVKFAMEYGLTSGV